MSVDEEDRDAVRLAGESVAAGDPTGWFERLYAEAAVGRAIVPWDRGQPHPLLQEWLADRPAPDPPADRALVVGVGLGEDAALLARRGWSVTAFDISPSAVEATRARFPDVALDLLVADLLDPPAELDSAFDLVFESYTVQSMPPSWHARATAVVSSFVATAGTLLVLAAGRDEERVADGPPWPLTPAEVSAFAGATLRPVLIEDLRDPSGMRRWRAEFHR